jgi:hypothetical protein
VVAAEAVSDEAPTPPIIREVAVRVAVQVNSKKNPRRKIFST